MSSTQQTKLEREIEERLALLEPDTEVLLIELVGGKTLRLYIDHPDGVSVDLCERVTRHLRHLLEKYSLEVSSPGSERPLVKPAHFQRFIGRRVRLRTRGDHDGRRSFTGELIAADDNGVTVGTDDGVVAIAYDTVDRASLAPESSKAQGLKPAKGKAKPKAKVSDQQSSKSQTENKTQKKTT